ncbi:MAG: tetratricopeptide repeat protein [Bryobacteraceae bacterium]|nr:tetratricopeptide repeat protein [Bryobacteraceae bacterium]
MPVALQRVREVPAGGLERAAAELELARACRHCGDWLAAETAYERALRQLEAALGPRHPALAVPLLDLAVLSIDLGLPGRAADVLRRLEGIALDPEAAPLLCAHRLALQGLMALLGHRHAQAESCFARALRLLDGLPEKNTAESAVLHSYLALASLRAGRRDEAAHAAERGLAILESGPAGDSAYLRALINFASILPEVVPARRAEPVVRRALELAGDQPWVPPRILSGLLSSHARLLRELGRKEEARRAKQRQKALEAQPAPAQAADHVVSVEQLRRGGGR